MIVRLERFTLDELLDAYKREVEFIDWECGIPSNVIGAKSRRDDLILEIKSRLEIVEKSGKFLSLKEQEDG